MSELLRGRENEAAFMAQTLRDITPIERKLPSDITVYDTDVIPVEPVAKEPLRAEQWRIIFDVIKETHPNVKEFLRSKPADPDLQGQSYGQLLLEYTTAQLSRQAGELEIALHRQGKIPFAIPGIGDEVVGMAIERHLRQTDALFGYYRNESNDLYRGGTVKELFAQVAQRDNDESGGGRILAGHPGMAWRSNVHVISAVGANCLPGVGAGLGLELRRTRGQIEDAWRNFSHPDAISVIHIGDASMAQGEVKEALDEMTIRNCPAILVVHNNGSGISTNLIDGSVGKDPIASARGLEAYGLTIFDVDGTDTQALYDTSRDAVAIAREKRTAVVLHVYHMYKRMHSSSDDPTRYTAPDTMASHEKRDPMPILKKYLIDHGVATVEQLDSIDQNVLEKVRKSAEYEISLPPSDKQEDLYRGVYAPAFRYGRVDFSTFLPDAIGEGDVLQSTREQGVEYIKTFRTDTQPLNMRQSGTLTTMQEMARDNRIIVFGEDVADFSTDTWKSLPHYLEERINEREGEFTDEQIARILAQVQSVGTLRDMSPDAFGDFVNLVGGKGGVFKNTQFLQLMFGPDRVRNSRLAEASIVGTATGYALAGYLPIVEIQFDAYWSPAYQQINDQLATLRWRSNGQFSAGMVIRIQGMNRVGPGVGGIGHGEVITGKLLFPGIRTVMPAHANESGPLLREAIRVARVHGEPVIFLEPINELNKSMGFYQGPNAHIPLGEAEIRANGDDFTVLTWSNNLSLVEGAAKTWAEQGIHPTIINMRALGVATDWKTVAPAIAKTGKVMIVESERKEGSAGSNLAARIAEHFFHYMDAPGMHVAARNMRTAAGVANEAYQLPQVPDIIEAGKTLAQF